MMIAVVVVEVELMKKVLDLLHATPRRMIMARIMSMVTTKTIIMMPMITMVVVKNKI